jgi:hypothetical protein
MQGLAAPGVRLPTPYDILKADIESKKQIGIYNNPRYQYEYNNHRKKMVPVFISPPDAEEKWEKSVELAKKILKQRGF